MAMSKADFERVAQGFKYVAGDPTADQSTVVKMVNEFCNAAESRNPRFNRAEFKKAVWPEPDLTMTRISYPSAQSEPEPEHIAHCVACGQPIDYCSGHGVDTIGDWIIGLHDDGDHSECNPKGCDEVCADFATDGSCIHSDHMTKAGL